MRNLLRVGATAALLFLISTHAVGLTASNGYEATLLFDLDDVDALAEWDGIASSFGDLQPNVAGEAIAVDSGDQVYAQVVGYDDIAETWYTGIVRCQADGTGLETVLQEEWTYESTVDDWFEQIRNVLVSPVSDGALVADHLVIVRDRYDATNGARHQIVVMDPDDPSDETVIHEITPGGYYGGGNVYLTIDAGSGDLFYMHRYRDSNDVVQNPGIRKLAWNGSSYDLSTVTTANTVWLDVIAGPSGYLYAIEENDGSTKNDTVLQIDPAGVDAWTDYATIKEGTVDRNDFHGWTFDSDGTFWASGYVLAKKNSRKDYVSEIVQGGTTSASGSIATPDGSVAGLAGGSDGAIYLIDEGASVPGVYVLTPSGDGGGTGGGGNGGGNGGGKGKNK